MEPRFGADFGAVRVHTDGAAVQMNHEINAQAFTHGNDIYFSADRYNPGTEAGKRLLAHELTHTIQQSGRVDRISRWGGPGNTTSHVTVTEDAFSRLGPPVNTWYSSEAQSYLAHMSEQMDQRFGFLAGVGLGMIKQKFGKISSDPDAYDNLQGYWRPPSEAPNHAEGGMYKGDGATVDLARVDAYINSALGSWGKGDRRQALATLALGLHAAEDRGAHGDGKPGTGHDPRRLIPPPQGAKKTGYYQEGWTRTDCDLKDKNPNGYEFGVQQAVRVLMKFAGKLGTGRKDLRQFTKPGKIKSGWRKMRMFFGKDVIKM
jgi:hypothetical protein